MKTNPEIIFAPEYLGLASFINTSGSSVLLVTNFATATKHIRLLEERPDDSTRIRVARSITEQLERRQARHSTGGVAISKAIQRWAVSEFRPEVPVAVVPNGINIASIQASYLTMAQALLPDQAPTVVTTGRISRWKGTDVLVDAMATVNRSHPTARLVCVGTPSTGNGQEIVASAERALGSRFVCTGHLDHQAALGVLTTATVAAFPSRFEGFGNGALEAMALGRPTVATSGGGFEEFLTDGQNGLLVSPADPRQLAHAIESLLSNPNLASKLGAAASRDAQAFDSSRYAEQIERYFEELLRSRSTEPIRARGFREDQ